MSTITYTATNEVSGESWTRSSGTMYYTHAVIVGSDANDASVLSWHKSLDAATKASMSPRAHFHGSYTAVVAAYPTAVNGKAKVGDYAGHPAETLIDALIEAKNAGQGNLTPKDAKSSGGNADNARARKAVAARKADAKETPAEARRRQRAAKKAREAAEAEAAMQAELDAQAAAREAAKADKALPHSLADLLTGPAILAAATEAAKAEAPVKVEVADEVAAMRLVKVEGKPQARLDTTTGKLVWRNSTKGKAAIAAGLWAAAS